ncbi:MAG TPA: hypothetical protein VE685_06355 [Thermoanaerobaculia bacterium]|nr:hypothetical protein [Thermoanaerobaculia bacterium]
MSRKRQLKKERARLGALESQLERLARQGDGEKFLELARGRAGELTPEMAELYGQIADRALESALASADLPRLERLLSQLGRTARSRRLGPLAEAVAHLAAGRLDEARAGLAALAALPAINPATRDLSPSLLAALRALSSPGGEAEDLPRGLGGLDGVQAIRRFSRALNALWSAGFRPQPAGLEELSGAVDALATSLPAEPALGRALQAAREHLRLLGELAGLEEELRSHARSDLFSFFLERLHGLNRPLLAVFRDGPPATAVLRPLHHALRLRWRALLELVASRGDQQAWGRLWEAFPALLALDLEPGGPPERLKTRAPLRRLRENEEYRQLAGQLGELAGAEKAPERVVLLWSLELWAWEREDEAEKEEEDEDDEPDRFQEPASHAALVRLGRMASEIPGRLPSGQRPGAARFLRDRLLALCETRRFCSHSVDAAGALLKLLPDDPALLVVALTGAACSHDLRAQNLFASRIASRGPAQREEREVLLRLLEQIVFEDSRAVVLVLPSLRALVGEEVWPEVLSIVLRSLTDFASTFLRIEGKAALGSIFREVKIYQPVLAERSGFAALEAALDCVPPDSVAGPQNLKELLARTADLEADLTALRVLMTVSSPGDPTSTGEALGHARDAARSHLDLRWRLWQPLLPVLVFGATRGQARRLRKRIQDLLLQDGVKPEDRQALERALSDISDIQRFERAVRWESTQEDRKPKKKAGRRPPRRRRAAGDQLGLDLF